MEGMIGRRWTGWIVNGLKGCRGASTGPFGPGEAHGREKPAPLRASGMEAVSTGRRRWSNGSVYLNGARV